MSPDCNDKLSAIALEESVTVRIFAASLFTNVVTLINKMSCHCLKKKKVYLFEVIKQ